MERWGGPGCREGVSAAGRVCGAWVGVPAVGRGLQDGGMEVEGMGRGYHGVGRERGCGGEGYEVTEGSRGIWGSQVGFGGVRGR